MVKQTNQMNNEIKYQVLATPIHGKPYLIYMGKEMDLLTAETECKSCNSYWDTINFEVIVAGSFESCPNKIDNVAGSAKNNQMIESQSATTFSEAHKNETKTFFEIVDADWDMYHPKTFETEEEARKVIREEYENRQKNDGYDKYWRNRKQIVVKVTLTKEILG